MENKDRWERRRLSAKRFRMHNAKGMIELGHREGRLGRIFARGYLLGCELQLIAVRRDIARDDTWGRNRWSFAFNTLRYLLSGRSPKGLTITGRS